MKIEAGSSGHGAFYCFIFLLLFGVACLTSSVTTGSAEADLSDPLIPVERAWLESRNGVIRLAPDPHYPPMEFIDSAGEYRGIAADFIALIEEKIGVRFEIVPAADFEEVFQMVRDGKIDMAATVIKTPQRLEYLLFNEPYISIPNVIVTRDDTPGCLAVADLKDKHDFAYQAGYTIGDVLAERYGITHRRPITDPAEALMDLSLARIDAMVGNLAAEDALRTQTTRFVKLLVVGIVILATVAGVLMFLFQSQRRIVAQREKALRDLGDSERRLAALMDNLPGMAYRCSVDTNRTMKFVSAGCRGITGYSPFDLVDNAVVSYGDIIHEKDRDYVWKEINRAVGEHRPFTLEYRVVDAGGNEKWVWDRGVSVVDDEAGGWALEGFISDITDRKRPEAELERYRAFVENVEDACFEVDFSTNIIFCNDAFLRPGGYTLEEYLQLSHRQRHPSQEEADRVYRIYYNVYQTGVPAQAVEYMFNKKSGEVGTLEASISLIRDKNGNPAGFRGIGRDVTERKRMEKEKEEALAEIRRLNEELEDRVHRRTAELEASNRELEAFAYSVSHDLRAPLRAIDGFSRALEEDWGDLLGEEGKKYLERIRAGCDRMAGLIDDLLDLSRITRAEMNLGTVDLSELAREIMEGLRREGPERRVDVTIAPGMSARGDRTLVRLALYNLLENAWKFTRQTEGAAIEFGCEHRDGREVWYVRDNGVGFDTAYVDKVFMPFQRLHRADEFPGTGIGLAIVQRIVQRHGGQLWAEGTPGKGATFYFTL